MPRSPLQGTHDRSHDPPTPHELPRHHTDGPDPTSFLTDHDLVVRGAEGESILRLPWFEEDLFVGRQLPDISEMPAVVLDQCTTSYRAGRPVEAEVLGGRGFRPWGEHPQGNLAF